MAFSQQQIDEVLARAESENLTLFTFSHMLKTADFKQHPAVLAITDYLTGKTNRLPMFQNDMVLFSVNVFLHLLENIETPSANDQLVLDLLADPVLLFYLQAPFHNFLMSYALEKDSDWAIQNAIGWLKRTGGQEENFYLACFQFLGLDEKTNQYFFAGKSIEKYVVNTIETSPHFVSPFQSRSGRFYVSGSPFSYPSQIRALLILLDNLKPAFATTFAQERLLKGNMEDIQILHEFKDGLYLQQIETRLLRSNVFANTQSDAEDFFKRHFFI